jgi:hypothetical protein
VLRRLAVEVISAVAPHHRLHEVMRLSAICLAIRRAAAS